MKRNAVETVMGAVVLVVAALFLFFAYTTSEVHAVSGYELTAQFDRVGSLRDGADVRISGIKVGTVLRQTLDPKTFEAVVRLSVQPDDQAAGRYRGRGDLVGAARLRFPQPDAWQRGRNHQARRHHRAHPAADGSAIADRAIHLQPRQRPEEAGASCGAHAGETLKPMAGTKLDLPVWRTPQGEPVCCIDKIKVLNENLEEIRALTQDAFEDAMLMGCDENQFKDVLKKLSETIVNPYKKS